MAAKPSSLEALLVELNGHLESDEAPEARKCYRALVEILPTSSLAWYTWMQFEWRRQAYPQLEALFSEALRPRGDVRMWRLYLEYVRAGHATQDAMPPESGDAADAILLQRKTMQKAYELALSHVGLDLDALSIYRDYIDFVQAWRTNSLYEQQVQMDVLRKVYHRALATPLEGIEGLWQQYDAWENGLNKLTAKKMLTDKSASYMAARVAGKELRALWSGNGLDRDTYALPVPEDPMLAARKCTAWLRWVEWEKGNPLKLPDKSPVLIQRIAYAYKGALAALWHFPEAWHDYACWLISTGKAEEAEAQLALASQVLPTDLLINFAYADLLESNNSVGSSGSSSSEDVAPRRGEKITAVYEQLLARLDTEATASTPESPATATVDTITPTAAASSVEAAAATDDQERRPSVETGAPAPPAVDLHQCRRLTLVYIQFMHYCRRAEGIASARAVFTRGRKSTSVLHQLYVAAAQMEYHFKKDPVIAGRIYELGMGKFAASSEYCLSYLHFLLQINDEQNARALFERIISSIPSEEALEIWKTFLDHAFRYADSATISRLTTRFRATYQGHPISRDVTIFLRKYSAEGIDLATEYDRLWLPVSSDAPVPLPAAEKRLPRPFYVPDSVSNLLSKLPLDASLEGLVDLEGLLKILQVVNMGGGGPLISGGRRGRDVGRPSKPPSKSPPGGGRNRGKRQRHGRLFDPAEEGRQEATNAPLRPDDIFAVRRTARPHHPQQ